MKKRFTNDVLLYAVLLLCVGAAHEKSEYGLLQDGQFRFMQILDLVHYDFKSFERFYPDREIDPKYEYRLKRAPFEYAIGSKVFSVFPWVWALLTAPLYLVFKWYGLLILPALFGFLSLLALRRIFVLLGGMEKTITFSLLFFILGTPLLIYSAWLYDATLCSFLLYSAVALSLKVLHREGKSEEGGERRRVLLLFAAGILTGAQLFLRIEVGFLSGLIISTLLLFNFQRRIAAASAAFLAGVILMFVLHFITNKWIYGIYEPLIMLDVITYPMAFRFHRILDYLFMEWWSLLVYFPFCFLTLLHSRFLYQERKDARSRSKAAVLAAVWVFILVLPFAAPQEQGMDLTPRYFFPVTPLLAFFVFEFMHRRKHVQPSWRYAAVVAYSTLFILLFAVVSAASSRKNAAITKELAKHIGRYNIVSSHHFVNYMYTASGRSLFLAESKDAVLLLDERIKRLRNERARIFLLKIGEFREGPQGKLAPRPAQSLWDINRDHAKEISTIPGRKIVFEDKLFVVFEIEDEPRPIRTVR